MTDDKPVSVAEDVAEWMERPCEGARQPGDPPYYCPGARIKFDEKGEGFLEIADDLPQGVWRVTYPTGRELTIHGVTAGMVDDTHTFLERVAETEDRAQYDDVEKPFHYNTMGEKSEDGRAKFEPIKVIESWGLAEGFCLGSALKYILRARHKGQEREDLEKAFWYLERLMHITRDLRPRGGWNMDPVAVAVAWELSESLTQAVAAIAEGNAGLAAHHVTLELSALKMAEQMAEQVDEEILAEVGEELMKQAAGFVGEQSSKPPVLEFVVEPPKDKYAGRPAHEAAGWHPDDDGVG